MTKTFERLTEEVRHRSSPAYPWLDDQYSPMSRIPCCDITPYLRDLFACGDRATIKAIMRALISANPALFVGIGGSSSEPPRWTDAIVDQVADLSMDTYVRFTHDQKASNLRAFLILTAKEGGGIAFKLLPRPEALASALLPDQPAWKAGMETLRERANRFLAEMKKDTPFWQDFEFFAPPSMPSPRLPTEGFTERLRSVPLGARVQFTYMAQRNRPLAARSTTDYFIRSFGFDAEDGIRELVTAGLIAAVDRPEAALGDVTREELIAAANAAGISSAKKSSKKVDVIRALIRDAHPVLDQLMIQHPVYEIRPQLAADVAAWLALVEDQASAVALLCFLLPN